MRVLFIIIPIIGVVVASSIFLVQTEPESYHQILPTDKQSLNVEFFITIPKESKFLQEDNPLMRIINLNFINPNTEQIQEHIDYRITILKDGTTVFGPIPLTHTSTGSVSIPVDLRIEGALYALIEVEGILFQPITTESVSFEYNTSLTKPLEDIDERPAPHS